MRQINRIIFLTLIFVIFFTGCIEEKTIAPMETPEIDTPPTATQEQTVLTPTPTPTPMPTPEKAWEPDVTLKPGYKWYQDDEFGYGFAYPEDWEKIGMGLSEGQENGVGFTPSSEQSPVPGEAWIWVVVYSDPTQGRFWESSEFNQSKEAGMVSKFGDVTINGRKGTEAIFNPFPGIKSRVIVFNVDDLYYMVNTATNSELYDKYKVTFEDAINSFIIR